MTLRQLQCVCEVINSGFNLSVAARALHISQPGISRYIQLLEEELRVSLFVRSKNRLVRLTPAGQAIAEVATRALREVNSIPAVAKDFREGDVGTLVIATNPGHARYSLPPVMERFIKRHPRVRVRIRQGNSSQVSDWVLSGDAELFISTGPTEPNPEMVLFPCHPIHPIVLTPPRHPLTQKREVTLEDLCAYPIITYDAEFAFHTNMMRAFHSQGLVPDILLSATDAEIMKIYVRAELGIAIVANSAHDSRKDRGLRALNVDHLFNPTVLHIGMRRNAHLTGHLIRFIEFFAPHLTLAELRKATTA
jgi:LysR family transcriptional regulator, cys regulon transcriptional activator